MLARSGYRRLWRASTLTFRSDLYALQNARTEIRNQFEMQRHESSPEVISELIDAVHDAEDFLLNNITQARQTDENTFRVELEDPHVTGRGQNAVGEDRNLDFSVDHHNVPETVPKLGIVVESSSASGKKSL